MPRFVNIILPRAIFSNLTYKISEDLNILNGMIIDVPLGKTSTIGVIWQISNNPPANIAEDKIKYINKILDYPPLSENLLKFIKYVSDYTITDLGSVLKMSIPISKQLNVSNLSAKKRSSLSHNIKISLPELSSSQANAVSFLKERISSNDFSVTLLEGVTGSGKTEVYFSALEEVYKKDSLSQILILLPEIILTTQFIKRFEERFGFSPAQWHSGVSLSKKNTLWQEISNGTQRIIVGARSALFLPYKKLSLIIVDEEHESSYKQEDGVIYHARDMAVLKAKIENIPIILTSATPSIETLNNVVLKKYYHIKLAERFNATMPIIKIVDMRNTPKSNNHWISLELTEAINKTLAAKQQVLLFLNRRGYAPINLCKKCGYKISCPNCSTSLVRHESPQKLLCHTCGFSCSPVNTCPDCKSENSIISCGPGIERIAESVKKIWNKSTIALIDSDHINSPKKRESLITDIINGNYDIIIGTQILAKGHHFPNLTLVGIIDADIGMLGGDLRAAEKCFQLLHQVSGRAGRQKELGSVIIQSYMPENNVITALGKGNSEEFAQIELQNRQIANMPPFSRMVALIISGSDENKTANFAYSLVRNAPINDQVNVLGPVAAPMYIIRKKYRFRILLITKPQLNIQKFIKIWLCSVNTPPYIQLKIDVDPYNFM